MKKYALVGLALMQVHCAKDRNLEDYRRDHSLKALAQYQAVEGRYSGLVSNPSGSRILGGLQLILKARLTTDATSPDNGVPVGTPQLITELNYQDDRFVSIAAEKGVYDPSSGLYEADFSVQRPDKSIVRFLLTAKIDGPNISGAIEPIGYEKSKATFSLKINGDNLAALAKQLTPGFDQDEGATFWYKAHTRFPNDPKSGRDILLSAYYPVLTPTDHFVEVFFPESSKFLLMDLNVYEDVDVLFSMASWDATSGNVVATGSAVGGSGAWVPQLRCSAFYFALQKGPFACDYWSNRSSDIPLTFNVCKKAFCK